jgi:hypothetical protein
VEITAHSIGNAFRCLGLTAARRADRRGVVELGVVLLGGVESNPHLPDHAALADDLRQGCRGHVGEFEVLDRG